MSCRWTSTRPLAIARLRMLSSRNPSNRPGNRDRTSNRMAADMGSGLLGDNALRDQRRRGGLRKFPGLARGGLLHAVPLEDRRHLFARLGADRKPVANPIRYWLSVGAQ